MISLATIFILNVLYTLLVKVVPHQRRMLKLGLTHQSYKIKSQLLQLSFMLCYQKKHGSGMIQLRFIFVLVIFVLEDLNAVMDP